MNAKTQNQEATVKTAKTVQHTPGPWHVEKHQRYSPHEILGVYEKVNYWFNLIVREPEQSPELRTPIAEIVISTESDSNARLIAAAPELLEALQAVMQFEQRITSCKEDGGTRATTTARAAIAKALGQQ